MIVKAIKEHGSLNRKDIDDLLWKKLPDWMNDTQRINRIKNLLSELLKGKKIKNVGTLRESNWILEKE